MARTRLLIKVYNGSNERVTSKEVTPFVDSLWSDKGIRTEETPKLSRMDRVVFWDEVLIHLAVSTVMFLLTLALKYWLF